MSTTLLRLGLVVSLGAVALAPACSASRAKTPDVVKAVPVPVASLPGHGSVLEDTAPKDELRMVPPEAYLKTYLQLFGEGSPLDTQKRAREGGLFDSWDDYFAALGFPDYRTDYPRSSQSNAMMMATFERLGIALCDRAVEHDLKGKPPTPTKDRRIFSFDLPPGGHVDEGQFASRFDLLHKRFLGYPAALAETERTRRFYGLFAEIEQRHTAAGAPKSRFTPAEAGWAAVCYGLVRHPEFHLY